MRSRTAAVTAAVSLSLLMTFMTVGSALAHTPIVSVSWDNATNPTRLIGRTAGGLVDNRAGSFYLRVFDSSGVQVDLGNAAVSPSGTEMTVSVRQGLPSGAYRVDWQTTGEDGERDSGSFSISIGASASPASAQAGGSHLEVSHGSDEAAHSEEHGAAIPTSPVTLEVRATGANQVPPVVSPVTAFARMRFNPTTRTLQYDVTVSGASPNLITAAHIHRGKAGTTGPHAHDLINAGFTQLSGSWAMTDADVRDLVEGNLYLNVHSVEHPTGAARAQLVLTGGNQHVEGDPSHETGMRLPPQVTPPRTGDGGLLGRSSGSPGSTDYAVMAVAGAIVWGIVRSTIRVTKRATIWR